MSALGGRPVALADPLRTRAGSARLVLAVWVTLAAVALGEHPVADRTRVGLAVALIWIPAAGAIEARRRRCPAPCCDHALMALDLGLVVAVASVVADGLAVVLVGGLVLVAYYGYLGGLRYGLVVTAAVAGMGLLASGGADRSGTAVLIFSSLAAAAALLALLTRMAARDIDAEQSIRHLATKSSAILGGIAEAIVVTDPSGQVTEWNPAAVRTFDCTRDQAVYQRCEHLLGLHSDLSEIDCSAGCALLAADGGRRESDVWRWVSPDKRQPLMVTTQPLVDRSGRIVEVVHSFRDVTRLKEADEAKTLFLATASHELKTPLTVMMGFSSLLTGDTELSDEDRAAALEAIRDRSHDLAAIVDRLLLSSRIESGRLDIATEALDVGDLLAERVASMSASRQRTIELSGPEEAPSVLGDRYGLATVVDHLLDNAIKYSPGDSEISVSAEVDRDTLAISVSDEGIGMSAQDVEHCFDRFWQAENGDSRRHQGTGIGLYVVRSVVEAMGGTVEAQSSAGAGTTMRVILTRADRPDSADGPTAVPPPIDRQASIVSQFARLAGATRP